MNQTRNQEHSARLSVRLNSAWQTILRRPSTTHDRLRSVDEIPRFQRYQDALAVVDAARTVIQHGWVQKTWYVMQTPGGRRRNFGPTSLTRLDHTRVVQACLVGAVVHAAWQQSSEPHHANPAIDALWRTLYQPDGPANTEPVGPVSSAPVRAARVRDLTRWNDRHDRTRDDVLRLLERTTERVVAAQAVTCNAR